MMVDLNKLTSFSISDKKEIRFDVIDKTVTYEIPFCLAVSKEKHNLYVGNTWDKTVELTDKDIEAILSGDDSAIISACKDFAWSLICTNRYCKK